MLLFSGMNDGLLGALLLLLLLLDWATARPTSALPTPKWRLFMKESRTPGDGGICVCVCYVHMYVALCLYVLCVYVCMCV